MDEGIALDDDIIFVELAGKELMHEDQAFISEYAEQFRKFFERDLGRCM